MSVRNQCASRDYTMLLLRFSLFLWWYSEVITLCHGPMSPRSAMNVVVIRTFKNRDENRILWRCPLADVMDAFVGKMRWKDGDGWNSGVCT